MKTETKNYITKIAGMVADEVSSKSSYDEIIMAVYQAAYRLNDSREPRSPDYSLEFTALEQISGIDADAVSEYHRNSDTSQKFVDEWLAWKYEQENADYGKDLDAIDNI